VLDEGDSVSALLGGYFNAHDGGWNDCLCSGRYLETVMGVFVMVMVIGDHSDDGREVGVFMMLIL